jgi:hypothetical protein
MSDTENKGYSVETPNPFVKSKRGGTKGNKGGGSKSVLEGGPRRGREHLCWGTSCGSDATRLAGITNRDPDTSSVEPVSFVPLCQSCAGKVKRKAEKKGLEAPMITPMTRNVSELYKMEVDAPSATPDPNVEKFIKAHRAGDESIHSMGAAKKKHQTAGGRWVTKSGNPNTGGKPIFKVAADVRRRKEAEGLTMRALKGEFESLKNG